MKKFRNSKKGFTLTEIMIVVAIFVIVSAAAFVGIAVTLNNAKDNSARLQAEHDRDNFEKEARDAIDNLTKNAADFFDIPYYTPDGDSDTSESTEPDTSETEEGGGGGGGGGGSPDGEGGDEITPTPTSTPTPTPSPTPSPSPTPEPSSGSVTVGKVTVPGGYNTEMNNGVGVTSVTESGGKYNISVHTSTNEITLTLRPSGNTYIMTFSPDGKQWMLDGMDGYGWDIKSYKLTSSQLTWIQNKWGFKIN